LAYTQNELDLYVMYLRLDYTPDQAAYLIHLERRRRLEGDVPGVEVAREMLSNPTYGGSMNRGRASSTPMLPAAMPVPADAFPSIQEVIQIGAKPKPPTFSPQPAPKPKPPTIDDHTEYQIDKSMMYTMKWGNHHANMSTAVRTNLTSS
jgi:hypothetical protein